MDSPDQSLCRDDRGTTEGRSLGLKSWVGMAIFRGIATAHLNARLL